MVFFTSAHFFCSDIRQKLYFRESKLNLDRNQTQIHDQKRFFTPQQ
ncbi:hypothetical protein C943_02847 [Mariniradius saccharolyticus AK6]|uniref:Uncharacterized protein n=1 Tax=Mariniradius saccharolyticus AK6 TaxID=1239962 RepID=M7YCQ5_9BACT|nr:hypothetical protein C943_02847 [Mariniradius saccharolyticus AK6]